MRWAVSDLPEGWVETTLGDVAEWGSGGTPSRIKPEYYGGKIPWIKTGELSKGIIKDTEEKITELGLKNSSAKIFKKGSVAIALYGATIGKTSILGIDVATNQACAVGLPIEGLITTEYLHYYLMSQKNGFANSGQGGAQPNISQGIIKSWAIPLAPLNEQKRIAEKLDSLLARVDSRQTHLERVPQILKRFRQSVLAAATSGRLTEDWREDHTDLPEYRSVTLREVATSFNYGTSAKSGSVPVTSERSFP
jgi:type I restriction enzyme S subunit